MKETFHRRGFLAQSISAGWLAGTAAAAGARPNIVVLLTDDQRWDTLGATGNRIIRTPNIDRLAESGVNFTNNFVTTSICMTSRASIFTGLYARAHQINDFNRPFTESQMARTYPQIMRAAGYYVGFIGKYGVGNKMPADRFDYWRGFPGQGHYYVQKDGKFYHLTRQMGDQSMEFLQGVPKGKPFCLSVSFKAPHVQDEDPRQFLYDPAHADWYKDVTIPPPPKSDPSYIAQLPFEVQRSECRRRWAVRFSTPALYQESVKSYYRLITEVDLVVGRIMDGLRRLGVAENTVVVFTSDNGFYLGERGLAGKWLMHEESIRTPMIVVDPRLPKSRWGQRRTEMTLNIDVAPTLLSAAGLPVPPSTQGRDLYPLMEGKATAWRKEWFYEHMYDYAWIPRTEGVRSQRWKYTRYLDTNPVFEEMYDLEKDPQETRNLAPEPTARRQLEELRGRHQVWLRALEAWREETSWRDPA